MEKPLPYGRYLLLDRVAVGGMAEVYVAVRPDGPPGHLYAVKRILPTLAEDHEFITMFLDEARLLVQLEHPGIVPIHDLGAQGEGYYYAMDYVAGRDLRALLDRCRAAREPLPVPIAASIAARVADALDHAHRKRGADGAELRVVHRDVSPANVLLAFDGSVRVIDFGIAQAAFRTRREDTVLRGKFGYMSPEMVRGQPVDRRSDVFALGAVLHEMLTGERLFRGKSELEVLEQVRSAAVRPPSEKRPGVPRGLDAVVLKALAPEPGQRYAWASGLRDALRPYARGGDSPAVARLMARTFPDDLRRELDRLERLRADPPVVTALPAPEPTQAVTVDVPPRPATVGAALAGADAPPLFRVSARPPAEHASRIALAVAAVLGAVAAIALSVLGQGMATEPSPTETAVAARVSTPASRSTDARQGAIVVQPRIAATLLVDGVPLQPQVGAGEKRSVPVLSGEHRVELRAPDGRRAGATVLVNGGEVSELLAIELN
jgi:eukaryotic-like serine/threonine-protein kinase